MLYTELTNKALKLAYEAHQGQCDACGMPYIFHPFCVAEQLDDESSVCAGLLHDIVEDTDITLEMLAEEFPAEVVEAVRLLTHTPDVSYEDYLRAIKENPIALKVKLADLNHNSDQTRFAGKEVSEERKAHFREKYRRAREILL